MKRRKTTAITIESDRTLVIRPLRQSLAQWCSWCGGEAEMVTVDEAAALAGVSSRTIYRWVEAHKLHFTETVDGLLFICPTSPPFEISSSSKRG